MRTDFFLLHVTLSSKNLRHRFLQPFEKKMSSSVTFPLPLCSFDTEEAIHKGRFESEAPQCES